MFFSLHLGFVLHSVSVYFIFKLGSRRSINDDCGGIGVVVVVVVVIVVVVECESLFWDKIFAFPLSFLLLLSFFHFVALLSL